MAMWFSAHNNQFEYLNGVPRDIRAGLLLLHCWRPSTFREHGSRWVGFHFFLCFLFPSSFNFGVGGGGGGGGNRGDDGDDWRQGWNRGPPAWRPGRGSSRARGGPRGRGQRGNRGSRGSSRALGQRGNRGPRGNGLGDASSAGGLNRRERWALAQHAIQMGHPELRDVMLKLPNRAAAAPAFINQNVLLVTSQCLKSSSFEIKTNRFVGQRNFHPSPGLIEFDLLYTGLLR
nr:protein argonaute 18-like [Drosophila kikkawai]